MFQFPGLSPAALWIQAAGSRVWALLGCPIRRPRGDSGCLPLPRAYRSLPRPSSTSCAKASAVRLYHLPLVRYRSPWEGRRVSSLPGSSFGSLNCYENSLSVIKHTFAIVMNRIVHDANTRFSIFQLWESISVLIMMRHFHVTRYAGVKVPRGAPPRGALAAGC